MRKPVFGGSDEAQDIDAKRVEAIQMAKIDPDFSVENRVKRPIKWGLKAV